jgi:protein-tyrosine-phosphatase
LTLSESEYFSVLFVCTANRCRSPMAAALLDEAAGDRGISGIEIGSVGVLPGGLPAAEGARATVDGLEEHVSHQVTAPLVRFADLVIGMGRSHVREVVVLAPEAFSCSFTLKELVRIASPRGGDESLDAWVKRVGAGRRPSQLAGNAYDDSIADPMGGPLSRFEATADELRRLIDELVDLAWPRAPQQSRADDGTSSAGPSGGRRGGAGDEAPPLAV